MPRHFLKVTDFSADEVRTVLARARELKAWQKSGKIHHPLAGKTLAMIFEKPSTRTRVSFEVGMFQLGGHALYLSSQGSQLGRGETYADTARVLSRFVDGIMIRTFGHDCVDDIARYASVPVINGLTDLSHPCQIMTDLLTCMEHLPQFKQLTECTIAYVGDGNNVTNSWIEASLVLGFPLAVATPPGYEPDAALRALVAERRATHITFGNDPVEAVRGAHAVNTDTWVSMGQEGAGEAAKKAAFAPFQVNDALMAHAAKDAIVLHCLPAHRNEEITDAVMDGPQSRVFDQAENRLHTQKAILEYLIQS